jgi:hypothetical protein
MGLFSFVLGLKGAGSAKKASRNAQAAELDYLNRALTQQQQQFGVTQANEQPFISAGTSALGQQGDLLGLHGDAAQQSGIAALMASPFYKSLYNNGLEANLQNASATGGLRGGNEGRSLANFGADTLSAAIQQQLANLNGLSTMGANTAAGLGSLSQSNANAQTGILGAQGQTAANGILTRGGITSGMWNSAGGFLDSAVSAALGAFPGLGGGGSGGFSAFASKLF